MPSTKVTATKLSKATKATKVTTKPKSIATKTVTAAVTEATSTPPTSAAPEITPTTSAVTERIQSLQANIVTLSTQIRSLSKELTAIQKEYTKEKRMLERLAAAAQKKRKPNGSTTVSGIAKPGYISPELCKFIGKDVGTEMARTEVIKHVNAYIKNHGLQDAKNKRIIRPDSKLQSLLKTKKNDEVTYFNLQTYMKRHYANPAKAVLNA